MPKLPSRRVMGFSVLFVGFMSFFVGPFAAVKLHGSSSTAPKDTLKNQARFEKLVYAKPSRDTELRKQNRLDLPEEPQEPIRLGVTALPTLEQSLPSSITKEQRNAHARAPKKMRAAKSKAKPHAAKSVQIMERAT